MLESRHTCDLQCNPSSHLDRDVDDDCSGDELLLGRDTYTNRGGERLRVDTGGTSACGTDGSRLGYVAAVSMFQHEQEALRTSTGQDGPADARRVRREGCGFTFCFYHS